MSRRRRLLDRIADASVLLPTCLGSLALAGPNPCPEVFAICAGITCVLHVWFKAEDHWRRERLLRAARRRRLRARHASPVA